MRPQWLTRSNSFARLAIIAPLVEIKSLFSALWVLTDLSWERQNFQIAIGVTLVSSVQATVPLCLKNVLLVPTVQEVPSNLNIATLATTALLRQQTRSSAPRASTVQERVTRSSSVRMEPTAPKDQLSLSNVLAAHSVRVFRITSI